MMHFNRIFFLFIRGLISLRRKGIRKTFEKIKVYIKRNKLSDSDMENLSWKSEYQENMDFSQYESQVKAIAFYLPQFHRIPENDTWWGNGFTEWTNTRKANPMFKGHYQPREPHDDIGYYDLTNIETLRKQAALAKQHGIYGFCFYLYWFSGKRLLEKPLDLLLNHPEIDIKFCVCWANENWTKRWDGNDQQILIKQEYKDDDPCNFVDDIKKYLLDERYIKINGEPVILVYDPSKIPNKQKTFLFWREQSKKNGIGNIQIWITNVYDNSAEKLQTNDTVDGEVDFPPNMNLNIKVEIDWAKNKTCGVYDYKKAAISYKKHIERNAKSEVPIFHSCMLGWDNAARRKYGWTTYAGFSLNAFYEWVLFLVKEAKKGTTPFFFINAWNEWAEGTYLEPDKKYGYASINTFSKAIFDLPFSET